MEADNLSGEWVRAKNVCATRRNIGGYKIHDYGRIHVYTFPSVFYLGAMRTVTLYTGNGTNTAGKRYWHMRAPVWNNDPPERAYLRDRTGAIASTWSEF